MRSGLLATSMALAAMASISMASAAREVGEIGEDVFRLGGPEPETKESELQKMSRDIDAKLSRRPINPPKQPNPAVEAAAAAKRARKAEELRRLAEKGAIGAVVTKIESNVGYLPGTIEDKATGKKRPIVKKAATSKAPTEKGSDKTKTAGIAKKPVIPAKKKAATKKV